jgi:tetratricopeptide (TPR) repeat protein
MKMWTKVINKKSELVKYYFLFLFLLATGFVNAQEDVLRQAETAYDKKKYKEAIEHYEQLANQGYKSHQLFFNLGNAYYRNNELGKAIFNYERARKINPDDEDVRINLGIANGKTIDKINAKENFFVTVVKTNVLSSFSTSAWAWLSVLTLFITSVLVFGFFVSPHPVLKRVCFVVGFLTLLGTLVSYGLGYSALKVKRQNNYAIILSKEIKIMNEPNLVATSKFTLHEGTKVSILENNGDWLLIKIDNGNEGWVKGNSVGVI